MARSKINPTIVVAIIGLLGTAFSSWLAHSASIEIAAKEAETADALQLLTQARNELDMSGATLDFGAFMEDWGETVRQIERLMRETKIDRFLLLRAWNGSQDPRRTTAVLQIRKAGQATYSYKYFALDRDYQDRLGHIAGGRYMVFNTADIAPSFIKTVYETEGVTSSFWSHIESRPLNEKSTAIYYASFSTHDGELTEQEIAQCAIVAGRLKGIAGAFYN